MKKRLTALAVTAALALSTVSVFAESGFSDLNEFHAWAEPQIEEMTTLGIIKGYTDGTFRPDRAITKTEALVLASRAAGFVTEDYDTFKSAAFTRYNDVVSQYNTPYPNEVCYLLYKGVLTEDDLASYIASDRSDSPLLRYEMAILLTKLMRAEDNLADNAEIKLDYSDAGEIPYTAAPYVDYATNSSLMQGVYDPEFPEDVFFKPYSSVTRAQMAVLLHRVLDKLEIEVTYASAVGKNAANNTITYRNDEGKTAFFTLSESTNLIVDGYKTETVAPVYSDAEIAFFYINNTLVDVEVVNSEENRYDGSTSDNTAVPTEPVEGVISTIVMSEECSIVVNDTMYTLSAASTIYVNHVAATIYDLRVGHTANLTFEGGKVITIYATSPSTSTDGRLTVDGVVTKLNVTNRQLYVDVENTETGVVSEKVLYIETGASIFNAISGQSVDFLSLEIDDTITATGTIKDDGKFYASIIIVK